MLHTYSYVTTHSTKRKKRNNKYRAWKSSIKGRRDDKRGKRSDMCGILAGGSSGQKRNNLNAISLYLFRAISIFIYFFFFLLIRFFFSRRLRLVWDKQRRKKWAVQLEPSEKRRRAHMNNEARRGESKINLTIYDLIGFSDGLYGALRSLRPMKRLAINQMIFLSIQKTVLLSKAHYERGDNV